MTKNYQVKQSRNNLPIPVVENNYFHSRFNPAQEAATYLENHHEQLKKKSTVLILGLGFGYHIFEVANILAKYHKGFDIYVIEPNLEMAKECLELFPEFKHSITVFHSNQPETLFTNREFVELLLRKPAVIQHPPSYNYHQQYFEGVLKHQAPADITSIRKILNEKSINWIRHDSSPSIMHAIGEIKKEGTKLSSEDFLLLGFEQIVLQTEGNL